MAATALADPPARTEAGDPGPWVPGSTVESILPGLYWVKLKSLADRGIIRRRVLPGRSRPLYSLNDALRLAQEAQQAGPGPTAAAG